MEATSSGSHLALISIPEPDAESRDTKRLDSGTGGVDHARGCARIRLTTDHLAAASRSAQHFSAASELFKHQMTWFGWELRWVRKSEQCPVPPCLVGERRAGGLQRCGRPRGIMPLAAAERERDLC